MNEKLTPIFWVRINSTVPQGIFHDYLKPEIKPDGTRIFANDIPKSVSEKTAKSLVKRFEKLGVGANAYHAGYKERGFRPTDKKIKTEYTNSLWSRERWLTGNGR